MQTYYIFLVFQKLLKSLYQILVTTLFFLDKIWISNNNLGKSQFFLIKA